MGYRIEKFEVFIDTLGKNEWRIGRLNHDN